MLDLMHVEIFYCLSHTPYLMGRRPFAIPRFKSLPEQVADFISSGIEKGYWINFLPGERVFAPSLKVSRRSLAVALKLLRRRGDIAPVPGRGHQILSQKGDAGVALREAQASTAREKSSPR